MRKFSVVVVVAFVLSAVLASSAARCEPWVRVKINGVEEGVWDSHHKKACYKISVGVQYGEVNRATVKLTSQAMIGGKKFSPSSTQNVGGAQTVDFLVPEDWLGSPGAADEIRFSALATGYYTRVEYRTVTYTEYVPVTTHY
jgi:hypothetical protein